MVDKPKDNKLDSEIAKRLDDLFGEGDTTSDEENFIEAEVSSDEENPTEAEVPSGDENPIEVEELSDDEDLIEAEEAVVVEAEAQEKQPTAADEEIFDLAEMAADEPDGERVPDDYPLAELKNLVLSIDWEITEEALEGLLAQIDNLKETYKKDKIILMFLQLLGSLGVYIKTNRGNAHPKTFKILNSVFSRLEEVVLSEDMAVPEK